MIRSKKVRNRPNRWRMVVVDSDFPRLPGRAACQILKSSTWRRPMSATDRHVGSNSVTRPAKNRRAMSNAPTVVGRDDTACWSKKVAMVVTIWGTRWAISTQVISGRGDVAERRIGSGSGRGRASAFIGPPPRWPGRRWLLLPVDRPPLLARRSPGHGLDGLDGH